MVSIVVVYNDKRALNEILLPSVKNQTAKCEFIPIDNTKGQFKSAAEALNYGGKQANGKYIMFVYQDVELGSNLWLENTERILDSIPKLGIAGVTGMSEKGGNLIEKRRGYISSSGELWGEPIQKPEEVQTLDECLLIVPKLVFSKLQFDEKTFDGWHLYGADYCLSVKQMGLKSYVIPAFIYHRTLGLNLGNLLRFQKRLYNKHKKNYKHIYAPSGNVSWLSLRLRLIFKILSPVYQRLLPDWVKQLKRELADCDTVLDLGCGYNSPLRHLNIPFTVGVEIFAPYLEESKKKAIHNQYIKADIRKIEFQQESFDAVFASEVLEHLTKQEGYQLLRKVEGWARRKVIITTPNGYVWQNGYDDDPFQEHRAGWNSAELKKLGFKVYGVNGWKGLRGYKASLKYKPAFLWAIISGLTQKVTYFYPRLAFQLFAIKYTVESGRK